MREKCKLKSVLFVHILQLQPAQTMFSSFIVLLRQSFLILLLRTTWVAAEINSVSVAGANEFICDRSYIRYIVVTSNLML